MLGKKYTSTPLLPFPPSPSLSSSLTVIACWASCGGKGLGLRKDRPLAWVEELEKSRHVHVQLQGTRTAKGNPLVSTMAARQRANVEEAALRAVFPQVVEAVRATDIIDQLYQRNLLEKNEYEGIVDALPKDDSNCKALTRRVLMAVSRRPSGFVPALVEVLREKYRSLAAALEKGE